VIGLMACLLVVGAALGGTGGAGPSNAGRVAEPQSDAPTAALSSSWFCAGATVTSDVLASGHLIFDNAGNRVVNGTAQIVDQDGQTATVDVAVPAGGTATLPERLPGTVRARAAVGARAGKSLVGVSGRQWVGAIVDLYGGMTSVSQAVTTANGSAVQPCASSSAANWYFAAGATVRNARDEISLLNPYPVPAIADLSFSTDQGQEQRQAFEGVVVPALGLTALNLGSDLSLFQRIAVTISARRGQIVAYQTEIATPPPASAPPIGSSSSLGAVVPVAGVTLLLGASAPATQLYWPNAADGGGVSETYDVYNPGPSPARLTLSLVSGGDGALGSSYQFAVGAHGTTAVTTNSQPWALPGVPYSTRLTSTNGAPVVAVRSVFAGPPSESRGMAGLLGEDRPATHWLLGAAPLTVVLSAEDLAPRPSARRARPSAPPETSLPVWPTFAHLPFSPHPTTLAPGGHPPIAPTTDTWLEVLDPGKVAAIVSVEELRHRSLATVPGTESFSVSPGQRAGLQLPPAAAGGALAVTSSVPILVEQDSSSTSAAVGMNLSPAVALSAP
jgi:hypothetical protein